MKKKYLSLIVLSTIVLSSCNLFKSSLKINEKEIAVYNIDVLDENKNLSSGYITKVKAHFIDGMDLIPYLSLAEYASLYESRFEEGFTSKVTKSGGSDLWIVSKGKDNYFVASILPGYQQVGLGGALQATLRMDMDIEALGYGLKQEGDAIIVEGGEGLNVYDYYDYDFSVFKMDKTYYYPLGLLDMFFSDNSGIYFTYNYAHIMSTNSVDKYKTTTYIDNEKEYTFNSQMKENKPEGTMPSYLADYNANLFLFLMDNFYGLKEEKGVTSAKRYYGRYTIYKDLFSTDSEKRVWAYSDALGMLDDHHTVLVSTNDTWYDGTYTTIRRGATKCAERNQITKELQESRSKVYKHSYNGANPEQSIIYSQDGKTAMFAFDSFTFGSSEEVFNEDGSIKSTAKNHDTFFKLVDAFTQMKEKGTVKNVILDISVNGGGYLGTMIKLLCLISKDNSSSVNLYEKSSGQLVTYRSQVDTNGDKTFDLDDCFGDEFNFYLLVSDGSFSCGNALPCNAQVHGTAKIIGNMNSGGGECVVGVHYLPNSEYVYHSGNLHMGYYDANTKIFTGFENGATQDIDAPDGDDFYSIEKLNELIAAA